MKNGESKTYYTDGSLQRTVNYADDKRNGPSKEYDYNTGNLKSEYHYKNNKKDGDYKLYDSDKKCL
ncbi:MAG: toxin-antitoxin system YwqK family antitoxin, partial [Prevotellaceae bacterium]|nr:toxin-antitoxin system YwqK family antitoxin [Prevotellaceae bacterium]